MTLKFDASDASSNQPVGTVTFRPDNRIQYGQDFRYRRGVPDGIEFQIFDLGGYWQESAPEDARGMLDAKAVDQL